MLGRTNVTVSLLSPRRGYGGVLGDQLGESRVGLADKAGSVQAPPARGAVTTRSEELLLLLLSALLLCRHSNHLPSHESVWCATSEEASLTAGQARNLARSREPFLELFPWDAPDATDPHRWDARGVWVVHRAKAAQDGRGMDAEPPRDLVRREELLLIWGVLVGARLRPCHCGSCVRCTVSVTCSKPFCLRSLQSQVLEPRCGGSEGHTRGARGSLGRSANARHRWDAAAG